jgi:hypothetical protein
MKNTPVSTREVRENAKGWRMKDRYRQVISQMHEQKSSDPET